MSSRTSGRSAGPKVVLDTNVIVAAALSPNGAPAVLFEMVLTGTIQAYATTGMLAELHRILAVLLPDRQEELLNQYTANVTIVRPETHQQVCRDPDDDMFLDCAIAADAHLIVSGDDDLLAIGEYQGIPILTVREFLERFGN